MKDAYSIASSASKTLKKLFLEGQDRANFSRSLQTEVDESIVTFNINIPMSDPNIDAASYLKALHAAIDKAIASGTLEKDVHHQAKTQNVEELEGSTIINQVAASPYTIVDEPKNAASHNFHGYTNVIIATTLLLLYY